MLCQIVNSLLLLPVSVARPLLGYLLDLLPPLDRLNRLLPAASPLEDQELQWPLHGECQSMKDHIIFLIRNRKPTLILKGNPGLCDQTIVTDSPGFTKTSVPIPLSCQICNRCFSESRRDGKV